MCHAKTNELVERLGEREQRDWTYFGWLRLQLEKKLRDPQDVLIEADRLRQQLKKRRAENPLTAPRASPGSSRSGGQEEVTNSKR